LASHITTEDNLGAEPKENLRIRAEQFLTAEAVEFDQISPADVKGLVLDLKMYQLQLEMQNEELQRAQETITQARDRYVDLYDFAPVGYFTLDRKGKIVEVNLAGAQLLGVERDLLVNRSSFRWVAPESREACRTHYRKVFQQEGRQTCEVKLRRRMGPPFYAALESMAVPGEAGEVLHCRTTMSDVTSRKQAEIELKLKERLLDGASDSIFLHDFAGHFIYVNEAACRDRGYEKGELQGKDVWALISPNYVATREKLLQDLQAQGDITFESAHVRKDGSVMPVEIRARIIDLEDRRLILSVARDITDRKLIAETLLKEKTLSDTIINSLPGIFYFFDDTGRFMRWNSNFEQVTGYTGEEFAKLTPLDLFDGEDKTVIDKAIQEVFLRGENTAEANILLKNGSKIPYFFTGRRIDLSGIPSLIGMGIDISDRQRAAEELRLAAAKWRTTFDAIGDPVGLMDQEGNILQCNQAMADLAGKPFPEIIGRRCWEVVHGTIGPIDDCPMVRMLQSHQREESVLREGESWLKVTVDPILDEAGNLTGAVHLIADITLLKRAEAQVQHSLEISKKALDGTVLAVANTMEMRDPYTAGHQRQVAQLACAIAQEMGFPADRVEGMRVLGCLHDIGKIAIPAEILSKPGRLSSMEFTLIKDHPQVGYEIIKDIDFPFPVAEGILQHHERLDGSGYPRGISGPDIILEARILGVADVVEAMASHRPYRRALGIDQALEEISRNRGILYDPAVVDICTKLFTEKGFSF
jgi:PAS domain S-box-containing protein/putative nucleotidyltransferase with HDIG domain